MLKCCVHVLKVRCPETSAAKFGLQLLYWGEREQAPHEWVERRNIYIYIYMSYVRSKVQNFIANRCRNELKIDKIEVRIEMK